MDELTELMPEVTLWFILEVSVVKGCIAEADRPEVTWTRPLEGTWPGIGFEEISGSPKEWIEG